MGYLWDCCPRPRFHTSSQDNPILCRAGPARKCALSHGDCDDSLSQIFAAEVWKTRERRAVKAPNPAATPLPRSLDQRGFLASTTVSKKGIMAGTSRHRQTEKHPCEI